MTTELTQPPTTARSRILAPTAALAGIALLLSGCGDGGGDETAPASEQDSQATEQTPTESVYQFDQARVDDDDDQEPFVASEGEVVVQLSDELKATIPEDGSVAIDHYTLSAKAFETGICRLDVDIAYTDGGEDALSAPRRHQDETPQANLHEAITDVEIEEDEVVDEVPSDAELENGMDYMTKDFSHATFVDECSENAEDDITSLGFPYSQKPSKMNSADSDIIRNFANVDIAVVAGTQGGQDGASIIVTGDTAAELSVTGEWAPPEY
ncbi:hypothetical protein NBM05_01905 [Rothia sp. AR01]|uniref:Uncharacterized protein n=1 Tax=Rothia santali TaxID=2949643 RepID=A0A9X2HFJ6_9MICC|nr:hypothetical protein [Rothia santali]MCP3424816.1 hypothetical protein [Rothia santali]